MRQLKYRDCRRRNAGTVGALGILLRKSEAKHLKNAGTVGAENGEKAKSAQKMQGL